MELLALILILSLLAALILPWVNLVKHSNRKAEISQLQDDLARHKLEVQQLLRSASFKDVPVKQGAASKQPAPVEPRSVKLEAMAAEAASKPEIKKRDETQPKQVAAETVKPAIPGKKAPSGLGSSGSEKAEDEQNDWFSKLAIWVGGIALLMAGFYMIKYSIESGWMTPAVRLVLTAVFGLALCISGYLVSVKAKLEANERIGQALSGAGIACLYFAAYAAVHLYHFISSAGGFGCMVLVTVTAVTLSLRNGAPIALMGLLGGFLTPLLMSSDSPDMALLFGYLFVLLCGAQVLCARRGWWGLFFGAIVGAYLWSGSLIVVYALGGLSELEGAMWFVMAVCASNIVFINKVAGRELSEGSRALLSAVRAIVWVGGLGQSLLLVWVVEFAAVDMALFSVLALGALFLSVYREEEFLWAAWVGFIAVLVACLLNANQSLGSWLITPLGLMLVFAGVAHWRGLRSKQMVMWRSLSMAALVVIAPVLYWNRELFAGGLAPFDALWFVLAIGSGALLALAGEQLLGRGDQEDGAVYQSFAVFVLAFGLWEFVDLRYLGHCIAGLVTASAIYWKRRCLRTDRLTLGALAGGWSLLMWNYSGEAVGYFFAEPFEYPIAQDGVAVLGWLAGVVASSVVVAQYAKVWGDSAKRLMGWWSGVIAILALVATYQWFDEQLLNGARGSSLMEGGLTALLAFLGLVSRSLASRWPVGRLAAAVMAGLVALRLLLLHLDDSGAGGESFFFNPLLLQFGLPFFAAVALAYLSASDELPGLRHAYQVGAMLLGFVWASFLVQDFYGGSKLFGGATSNSELYTYSVVWLSLAVAYQVVGLLRDQRVLHVGSLLLLLLTVGKVFLVDASELEGLFRVLSFLGLGLTLIGIGFFYNKVVFGRGGVGGS